MAKMTDAKEPHRQLVLILMGKLLPRNTLQYQISWNVDKVMRLSVSSTVGFCVAGLTSA